VREGRLMITYSKYISLFLNYLPCPLYNFLYFLEVFNLEVFVFECTPGLDTFILSLTPPVVCNFAIAICF